jgi:hypothetical protein
VAAFNRNAWPPSIGIGGRNHRNAQNGGDFAIPDEWWHAAGMIAFKPTSPSYSIKPYDRWPQWPTTLIPPAQLVPPRRDKGHEFDCGGFQRNRMIGVLREIALGLPMCAIEVWEPMLSSPLFQLRHGFHRYYASIAAGFDKLPVGVFRHY